MRGMERLIREDNLFIDIDRQLHFIPQVLVLFVLFIFAYLFISENRGKIVEKIKSLINQERWLIAFLFYTSLLFSCTVLARTYTRPTEDAIGQIALMQNGTINVGTIENILMFVPYTYLYSNAFRRGKTIWKCLLLSIVTTVLMELCQLVFLIGWFQLADMIHNTIGGMIGYGLWFIQEKCLSHGWVRKRCKSEGKTITIMKKGKER